MKIILCHGWGHNSQSLNELALYLQENTKFHIEFFERGYFNDPENIPQLQEPWMGIGHSFGFLELTKYVNEYTKALVSICGFKNFIFHEKNQKALDLMIQKLEQSPFEVIQKFHLKSNNGEKLNIPSQNYKITKLLEDLQDMRNHSFPETKMPILALAGKHDSIVSYEHTLHDFQNNNLHWHDNGHHNLPLHDPDWCVHHIQHFIESLA